MTSTNDDPLTEEAMGMLLYANSAPGFSAVLKQRYSDFIVNEVSKEGEVVRLTQLSAAGGGGGGGGGVGGGGGQRQQQQKQQEKEESDDKNNKKQKVEGGEKADAGTATAAPAPPTPSPSTPPAEAPAATTTTTTTTSDAQSATPPENKEAAAAPPTTTTPTEEPTDEQQRDLLTHQATTAITHLSTAAGNTWSTTTQAQLTADLTALLISTLNHKKSTDTQTHTQTLTHLIFPPTEDKAIRRGQHQYFKVHFAGVFDGDTVDAETEKDTHTHTPTEKEKEEGGGDEQEEATPKEGDTKEEQQQGKGKGKNGGGGGGGGGGRGNVNNGGDRKPGGLKSVRIALTGSGKRPGLWGGYANSHTHTHTQGGGKNNNNKRPRNNNRNPDDEGGQQNNNNNTHTNPHTDTHRPKYLHFTLYKENHTTTSALASLAKTLHIKDSRFSFAGMKDKRGLTTQRCAVFRLSPSELLRANRSSAYTHILVGNTHTHTHSNTDTDTTDSEEPLRLGQLGGNRFKIVLRNLDISVSDTDITHACAALAQSGFINYFGAQRFGSYGGASTPAIGAAIIHRNWKCACDLILSPRQGEDPLATRAREVYTQTHDAKAALALLPRQMNIEQAVLRAYVKNGKDAHLNALQAIPKNIQLMYLHAFQSEIWNFVASYRLRVYGMGPYAVCGDLVYVEEGLEKTHTHTHTEGDDGQGERHTHTQTRTQGKESGKVRVVTKEEEERKSVGIEEVVLPMPGVNVVYPQNGCMEEYTRLFAERGMKMEDLENSAQTDYTLGGDYRKLLARPGDFKWVIRRYKDASTRLAPCDVDLLSKEEKERGLPKGRHWERFLQELDAGVCVCVNEGGCECECGKGDKKKEGGENGDVKQVGEEEEEEEEGINNNNNNNSNKNAEGEMMRALCLEFTLPPSTYATMLLRELLKRSMTTHEMKKLNPVQEEGKGGGSVQTHTQRERDTGKGKKEGEVEGVEVVDEMAVEA